MKKLFKKVQVKKSFLRRSRYLFFIKNNKKNIINYGSFLKKFDFYFFFFFYFKLNFFFFKNFVTLFYASFQKKPNFFFYKFFFFNFLKLRGASNQFFNFKKNGQLINFKESDLNFFSKFEDSVDVLEKNKKKWLAIKFFFFGNSYFLKNFNFFKNITIDFKKFYYFYNLFFKKILIFKKIFNLIFFFSLLNN